LLIPKILAYVSRTQTTVVILPILSDALSKMRGRGKALLSARAGRIAVTKSITIRFGFLLWDTARAKMAISAVASNPSRFALAVDRPQFLSKQKDERGGADFKIVACPSKPMA